MEMGEQIYEESIEILRENQHENGGFFASPPSKRYPIIYTRDHTSAILGAISARLFEMAKKGLEFILSAQKPSGEFSQRYDIYGVDASYKDLHIDVCGMVLFALNQYYEAIKDKNNESKKFIEKYWNNIEKAVDFILLHKNKEMNLIHTIYSIHEFPAYEMGFEIFANCACCAGILGAVNLGKELNKDVSIWEEESKIIKDSILTKFWSPRRQSFLKNIQVRDKNRDPVKYDEFASVVSNVDVAEYAPAYFDLIKDNNPKIMNTVKRIDRNLWDSDLDGLNRYPVQIGNEDAGYGSWPLFTCQIARHFAAVKDIEMTEDYLEWVIESAYNYQLPEHISLIERFELWLEDYVSTKLLRDNKLYLIENIRKHPMWEEGLVYVTTPFIWSHAEYIQAYNLYKKQFL